MKEWEYVMFNTVEYFKMHIFTYLLITQKQFHGYKVEMFFNEQLFKNVKMYFFFVNMGLNLYTLWFYIILFLFYFIFLINFQPQYRGILKKLWNMIIVKFPFFFMNIEQRFIHSKTRHIHSFSKSLPEFQMLMFNPFFLISRFGLKTNFALFYLFIIRFQISVE